MPLKASIRPVRINRIKVKIRTLSLNNTVLDMDFRETKENRVYSQSVEVIGQIVGLEPTFRLERSNTGDALPSLVHFVFRFSDLDKITPGFLPKKGDRIVEINGVPSDFNIIKASKASPFGGNRQKAFAKPILLHVDAEQQRKQLGSI
jgi:hypothetical protein